MIYQVYIILYLYIPDSHSYGSLLNLSLNLKDTIWNSQSNSTTVFGHSNFLP